MPLQDLLQDLYRGLIILAAATVGLAIVAWLLGGPIFIVWLAVTVDVEWLGLFLPWILGAAWILGSIDHGIKGE